MTYAVPSSVKTDLYIGGQWRPASGGARIDVVDPATGKSIATVADGTIADALSAVDAAAAAAASWAATAPRRRSEILRKAYELMTARADEIARLISLENGKALSDARGEVTYAAEFFRWFSEEAVRIVGEISTAPSGANKIIVQHQPIGIALMITPWNFPAAMATRKIGPALAAGCTCILKPAAETPLTAFVLAQILEEAGVPPGVVNVVTTSNSGAMAQAVLADDRVRKLSFTGSTRVGSILLKQAAERVVNCSMELGGNAPFVVFDDADLEAALDGAMIAKMRNAGEACTAANRFYVQSGLYDAFVEGLTQRMAALKVGPGLGDGVQVGPMINEGAVRKIDALMHDAIGRGAKARIGGARPSGDGYFYPPTVLAEVAAGSELLKEEIFGPVAPVVRFDTEDEAIRCANDTEFGLIAYVFSGDLAKALRVAEKIDAGMVAVNRGLASDPAAPFGGMKQSGLGREGAHHGILEYLEVKYIAAAW